MLWILIWEYDMLISLSLALYPLQSFIAGKSSRVTLCLKVYVSLDARPAFFLVIILYLFSFARN